VKSRGRAASSAPRKAQRIGVAFSPRNAWSQTNEHQRVGINTASGEGAIRKRRSAARLQRVTFSDRRVLPQFHNAANHFPAETCRAWLRMCPVGHRYRTATIVVTATRIVNHQPRRFCDPAAVAGMRRLTNTAGMRLPRRNRQRQWDEVPHQHEQQKKSGSQAMHISGSPGVSPAVASAASITKSRAVANQRY
jgi:hypothetical protein